MLLLATALPSSASAAAAAEALEGADKASAAGGALFIAGGAVRPDNAEVWSRLVAQAGGAGARFVIVPSAAGDPVASGKSIAATLTRYGAQAEVLPLSPRWPGGGASADDTALVDSIARASGVYFTGGDQQHITATLLKPNGQRSRVLQAIWDVYGRGGVIAGSSAGAAIMSATMFGDAGGVLATLQGSTAIDREIAPGLGFIGNDVFIDQHLLVRGRFARMLPVMLRKGFKTGLGIDENTAMVITGRRMVEVVGYKGAILLDLREASSQPGAFNVRQARISYLDQGDRYDLQEHRYLPGADKQQGKVDRTRPYFHGPVFSNDILSSWAVVDLMQRLLDGDQQEATGYALSDLRQQPASGFMFRFQRDARSAAYLSNAREAYGLLDVRLDVEPLSR